ERHREEEEVAEGGAGDEEERAEEDEGNRVELLVLVEPGGDEGPDLPEEIGARHEDADEERHLHVEEERLRRPREDELLREAGPAQGLGHEVEDLLAEVPARGEPDAERDRAAHEP